MNWFRIVLDGVAMSLVFNMTVELRNLALVIYPLYIGIIAWMILSAHSAGVQGFWNLFWTAYIEMLFVNFGDFLILDCWLRTIVRNQKLIVGAEDSDAWEVREYMKQAVPEHFIVWPLVLCSLVGLLCAWIGNGIG